MVLYECYNCGYTNLHKCKMRNHLSRQRICKKIRENINLNDLKEIILQGVSYQEYLNLKLETVDEAKCQPFVSHLSAICKPNVSHLKTKEYICNYCSKEYKHRQSLSKHKNKCKLKLDKQLEADMINLLQKQLDKQDKQLKTKDKHLDNKDKELIQFIKQSNKTINNGIINNNIIINSYKTPDLSHLTSKDIYSCLSKNVFCVAELIEKIYFNKDKPENHNICLTNLKTPYISVFDGTNWNVQKKVIAFDDLLDHCENTFTDFIAEWNGKYPETVEKFNKFLDRIYDDADALRKKIYEDLTYKMYNNSKKLNIKI
jgi:hypothetical protein